MEAQNDAFITYYRRTFTDWFFRRREECPLCSKKMKPNSVRLHIKNCSCPSLLCLEAKERKKVLEEFQRRSSRIPMAFPHDLSDEEKLVLEIEVLEKACYWASKVFIFCHFRDGKTQWIPASTIEQTRVGRRLIRREYRKGFLRYFIFFFSK